MSPVLRRNLRPPYIPIPEGMEYWKGLTVPFLRVRQGVLFKHMNQWYIKTSETIGTVNGATETKAFAKQSPVFVAGKADLIPVKDQGHPWE